MTLDLLHEFANTEIFCLFHNCMWQSRHSFDLNANSSSCISEWSLSSSSLLLKSVTNLFKPWEIFDQRVRIVFVYRFNSYFHSILTLQITGCDFQHGSNFDVRPNPNFWVRWFFISWQNVLTTCHWFCELWEFFSVLCHEILSDSNCCRESCNNTNLNHTILLWEPFNSFLVLLQKIFLRKIIDRKCKCFHPQTCWHTHWDRLSCQYGSPRSYMANFVFLTLIWNCSENT